MAGAEPKRCPGRYLAGASLTPGFFTRGRPRRVDLSRLGRAATACGGDPILFPHGEQGSGKGTQARVPSTSDAADPDQRQAITEAADAIDGQACEASPGASARRRRRDRMTRGRRMESKASDFSDRIL